MDHYGWTTNFFPIPGKGSYALGQYGEDGTLLTASAALRLKTRYYNREFLSTGISAVASDPAARNKGQVREILNKILRREKEAGSVLSTLCPFSHTFYQKFGYGGMGYYPQYRFAPEDIRGDLQKADFSPFLWKDEDEEKIKILKNNWLKAFNGGIIAPFHDWKRFQFQANYYKQKAYQFKDSAGNLKAWFLGRVEDQQGKAVLDIFKMHWDSPESLQALFSFLKQFRGQVQIIHLRMPLSIPVFSFLTTPRIDKNDQAEWMGRPINITALLEAKAAYHGFTGDFTVKVTDPVLDENSGVYTVNKGRVSFNKTGDAPEMDFHLFSSLLLGGLSLKSCRDAGLISGEFGEDADELLPLLDNVFITDPF